jgi:hypothetical protein
MVLAPPSKQNFPYFFKTCNHKADNYQLVSCGSVTVEL